jgi:hypothetical protein
LPSHRLVKTAMFLPSHRNYDQILGMCHVAIHYQKHRIISRALRRKCCLHPNWFSENTVPAAAPSVNSTLIVRRLKITIGRKIATCRMQITTAESIPCSAYLTAHNFLYLFSQRSLLSSCQQLLFQLQNHYKSVYNLRHSATTAAVYILWVEGLSSRSTGCLTSLHNLGWNFLKTCIFSHPNNRSFVEWMLGVVSFG